MPRRRDEAASNNYVRSYRGNARVSRSKNRIDRSVLPKLVFHHDPFFKKHFSLRNTPLYKALLKKTTTTRTQGCIRQDSTMTTMQPTLILVH